MTAQLTSRVTAQLTSRVTARRNAQLTTARLAARLTARLAARLPLRWGCRRGEELSLEGARLHTAQHTKAIEHLLPRHLLPARRLPVEFADAGVAIIVVRQTELDAHATACAGRIATTTVGHAGRRARQKVQIAMAAQGQDGPRAPTGPTTGPTTAVALPGTATSSAAVVDRRVIHRVRQSAAGERHHRSTSERKRSAGADCLDCERAAAESAGGIEAPWQRGRTGRVVRDGSEAKL